MANLLYRKPFLVVLLSILSQCYSTDILGCGGFVKSHVNLDFSKIEIGLYTKEGSLKEKTECAPTNGYYFLPLEEKGEYVLRVHPPAGWSFEPSEVDLTIDGETDQCSIGQDINFAFNGFGITGKVNTAGQKLGPSGISVQLINDEGEVRNTVTAAGGAFHFTPVIPGKYTLKAHHSKWKLDPAQAQVQVREGNTALPLGVLTVKGYDVMGSVSSFGNPIAGVHVLLYSQEESPKFRVEGCKTALLQGVPDSPICYSVTDVNGEFSFGLVPAGDYKLMAMSKSPGQSTVSYNIKPDMVPFTVQHGSIYVKNAFEVTGFTVVGSVLTSISGNPMAGTRVLLGGEPIATTDAAGKYTLTGLKPGTYVLNFQHEQCEFEELQLSVSAGGPAGALRAAPARWRVCGAVSPPLARRVAIAAARSSARDKPRDILTVATDSKGKWCTYLPPGVYSARVEVSEQELRDGLQFYPEWQQITMSHAPVAGVTFSQLRATVTGEVQCDSPLCAGLTVELRSLSADGGYIGSTRTAPVVDGKYTFTEVSPGSVEVSVPATRLCWRAARQRAAVAAERAALPPFLLAGARLPVAASHRMQLEYSSASAKGVLDVPQGSSSQCLPAADVYTLTPRGCHQVKPAVITVDMAADELPTVHFVAVSHASTIRVLSPDPVTDLMLEINSEGQGMKDVGPLVPLKQPQGYAFEHTIYLAEGEISVVMASSSSLLFEPPGPQQVLGRADCDPAALVLHAARGLTLAGRTVPPVADATVTLTSDELTLTQVTGPDGAYSFGPLDASRSYRVAAEKDSYVFSAPDPDGNIQAHKLAEITVELFDEDDTPLEGALVSVSGGAFRRNVAASRGVLRFGSLPPAQYYVKPSMKEYRFAPPHAIVPVDDGRTHALSFRGIRVAWSVSGRTVSLGKVGIANVPLKAVPSNPEDAARCPPQEATGSVNGDFRIRGLPPNCHYTIELKESSTPELAGLKLAKAPPTFEVKEKDIENVRLIVIQPNQVTDANVLVRTPNIEHYKTLRLSLALETTPQSPLFSTRLDAAGYSQALNPGLVYVLPRLPADNKTYVLSLESTLSKATHNYGEYVYYYTSDGRFKHFDFDFVPKVRSSEQELRQTSVLAVPLLALVAAAFLQRERLVARLKPDLVNNVHRKLRAKKAQ
ncbi:BOS complex subunit NOMO3 [Epargyreus clarus]|uniref:BOS complex subunit NOMO3 n=1 Tax=Epargyreus clarus TaxID=520877 RepID=UPI003C302C2E